ncbi:unnamed protein product [Effrenium voratum]|uniref:ABM domain-containing protein n=1 Tax=Effrenium voratum TaxID=2562239 RepID=A0AA36JNU6_9DINO|nr:unnamed protein product [Effrenium voratum]CAJ1455330.1 unnamed protein product [Effrenium voratum]
MARRPTGSISRLRLPVLIALAIGTHVAFVIGWNKAPAPAPEFRTALAAVVAEPKATSEAALLPGERYIASNRFAVREGAEAAFEQRWAQRKSSLLTLPGFRWFSLMRRVATEGSDPPDDYSYISFTIWETKKDFNFWRKGPAFKEAHGGGGIMDFLGMIVSGFMTSKGPPKPFFWEGLAPVASADSQRLLSGPGGRPEADGKTLLDPEVFVATKRFNVAKGREEDFEKFWSERGDSQGTGFRFSQLLRRDQVPDDNCNYLGVTVWDDRAAFEKSTGMDDAGKHLTSSPSNAQRRDMLAGQPMTLLYEGKLVLESEAGP